jgi:RNA polymerase sigma-70 factor (ECF subfamily)
VGSLHDETTLRLVEEEAASPSPESAYLAQEQREAVWKAVQSLPNKYRLPVVLRYYQDFSYAEMAAVLCVPETTVDTRLRKAKAMLRQKLAGWVQEEERP